MFLTTLRSILSFVWRIVTAGSGISHSTLEAALQNRHSLVQPSSTIRQLEQEVIHVVRGKQRTVPPIKELA
jgi:hypothetical protein